MEYLEFLLYWGGYGISILLAFVLGLATGSLKREKEQQKNEHKK